MNFNELKSAIEQAAKAREIAEYEIYYMASTNASMETLNGEINSSASSISGGLCLRLVVNGKMGYASTELMEIAEMTDLVDRAIENANFTDKEDTVGIFEGSESYEKTTAPAYSPADAAELKKVALELAKETYAASDKIQNGTATAAITEGISIRLCNSHGLDLQNEVGVTGLMTQAVVCDNGEFESDYSIKEWTGKENLSEIAKETVDSALEKIGAGLVESGKYNIIIDGKQMRSILSAFSPAFSAKNAQMSMSLLRGKEGEVVASDVVTITDDPMRKGTNIQTYFDAEGVAAHRKNIIENGVLKTLLHNRETAKIAGVESTGNASKAGYASPIAINPYAFCIEAGTYTKDALFALADHGIYITEVKGLHAGANPITGDFSIESAGFLIENGKKAGAVKSFTIAGNFFDLLKQITALSDTVEISALGGFTTFGSPAVLIKDMSVAGK